MDKQTDNILKEWEEFDLNYLKKCHFVGKGKMSYLGNRLAGEIRRLSYKQDEIEKDVFKR